MDLPRAHTEQFFHDLIGFTNELHIAVLDAVVHHLDEMTGAVLSHPITARSPILHFGSNGLKDRLDMRPRRHRTAGHDGRTAQRSFLPSRHPRADVQKSLCFKLLRSSDGIGEM